jgi:hypothetical protein
LPKLYSDVTYSVAIWTRDSAKHYSTVATTTFVTRGAVAPSGRISGTVTDHDGAPLHGVVVDANDYLNATDRSTTTDGSGHYSLTVPAGPYYVGFDGSTATGGASDPTGYLGDSRETSVTAGHTVTGFDAKLDAGAAVSGRVTDAAGHPLAGVTPFAQSISSYVDLDSSGFFGTSTYAGGSAAATTADDGTFTVKGLPRYPMRFCFDTSGRVTGGDASTGGYTQQCTHRAVVPSVGSTRALADIVLPPASGGAVAGRIVDHAGAPVAGAPVSVQSHGSDAFASGFTRSAADGTYVVPALPAGSYDVCVYGFDMSFASTDVGDATTCSSHPVTVTANATTTADLRLTRGGAVSGKLTGPNGAPLAHVGVTIQPASGNDTGGYANTDSSGHFVAKGIVPGSYTVCFDATAASGAGLPTGAASSCYRHNQHIVVKAGLTRLGIDAKLGTAGAISGRVTNDRSPAQGLAGAMVEIESTTDPFGDTGGWGQADGQGRYTATGLPAGSYTVCFDYSDFTSRDVTGCYGGGAGKKVTVHAGSTTSSVNATLSLGGSITVHVQDADGHPVAGVDATALGTCGNEDSCGSQPLFSATTEVAVDASDITDADGNVTLTNLEPGKYAVCLFAYYGATTTDSAATGYADSCGPGTTLDVVVTNHGTTPVTRTLSEGGEVTGRITDADGHPLAGVEVDISNSATTDYDNGFDDLGLTPDQIQFAGPRGDAVTAADGTYTVHGVTPGAQTVCVLADQATGGSSAAGYLDQCVGGQPSGDTGTKVDVAAGQVTSGVDVSLTAGAGVSGTVKTTTGRPLVDVSVIVFSATGDPLDDGGITSASGRYAISRLPAGTERICFSANDPSYRSQCFQNVAWSGDPENVPAGATPVVTMPGTMVSGIDAKLSR